LIAFNLFAIDAWSTRRSTKLIRNAGETMNIRFALTLAPLLMIASTASVAETLTINSSARGNYTESGAHSLTDGYFTGQISGTEYRSYFAFDLSTFYKPVGAATLSIQQTGFLGSDDFEELFTSPYAGAIEELTNAASTGTAVFNALGTGSNIFPQNVFPSSNGTTLTASLIQDRMRGLLSTHAAERFAFGSRIRSIDTSGDQGLFFNSASGNPTDGRASLAIELLPGQGWMNPSGGTWSNSANWTGGTPAATDDVFFQVPGDNANYSVALDGPASAHQLYVVGNRVDLNLNHSTLALTQRIRGYDYAGGTLNLSNGTVTIANGPLLSTTVATDVNISLADATLSSSGALLAGHAQVVGSGGDLFIGGSGDGTLQISNGLTFDFGGFIDTPGADATGGAFISVTGAGSQLSAHELDAPTGAPTAPKLEVENGGFANIQTVAGKLEITVSGQNSWMNVDSFLSLSDSQVVIDDHAGFTPGVLDGLNTSVSLSSNSSAIISVLT
jgi:hypothetical protein